MCVMLKKKSTNRGFYTLSDGTIEQNRAYASLQKCCHNTEMSNLRQNLEKSLFCIIFNAMGRKRHIIEDIGFKICIKDTYNKAITQESSKYCVFFSSVDPAF